MTWRAGRLEHEKRERAAAWRWAALRRETTPRQYLALCRQRLAEEGVVFNAARSVVWRDVVLGLDGLRPIPYLEEYPAVRPAAAGVDEAAEPRAEETASLSLQSLASRFPGNCHAPVIAADIERSLWSLYPDDKRRDEMRLVLKQLLLRVLLHNPDLHYYQGLHELAGFVMYVMEPHHAVEVVVAVCDQMLRLHWRTFAQPQLQPSQAMLYAMHAVVSREDPKLAQLLENSGVGPESHYAVSWLITWFTHVLSDWDVLARLFDFFISQADDTTVLYFAAALLLRERARIQRWVEEAVETTMAEDGTGSAAAPDPMLLMARMYGRLTNLPREVLQPEQPCAAAVGEVRELVQDALRLKRRYAAYVEKERGNFMRGEVRQLGMLANGRTRNAALRLLWRLLPRDWRRPAETNARLVQSVGVASAVLVAAVWVSAIVYGRRYGPL